MSAQLQLLSLLSPYLIFQHSGMFTIHICNTYVIPMSTTPCTRVTILTQLCCSLGAQPEFPRATERGSRTLLLYDFKSDAGSPTSLNK